MATCLHCDRDHEPRAALPDDGISEVDPRIDAAELARDFPDY